MMRFTMGEQPGKSRAITPILYLFVFSLALCFISACQVSTPTRQSKPDPAAPTAAVTRTPADTPTPSPTPTITPVPILFDTITDENIKQIQPVAMLLFEKEQFPGPVAFSQGGSIFSTTSHIDDGDARQTVIHMRHAANGEVFQQIDIPYDGLLYHDGLHFLAFDDTTLYLYDLLSGQITAQQTVEGMYQNYKLLSPDDAFLVIYGPGRDLEVWDLKQGKSAFKPVAVGFVYDIAFSQDGKTLAVRHAVSNFDDILVYDLKTGSLINTFSPRAPQAYDRLYSGAMALSPDGSYLALCGSFDSAPAVFLWDVQAADPALAWQDRIGKSPDKNHTAVTFSPDGQRVAFSIEDQVYLFDVKSAALQHTLSATEPIAFSPDSRYLASAKAGTPTDLQIWNVEQGKVMTTLRGHTDQLTGIWFAPNGKLLTSNQLKSRLSGNTDDALVHIWAVAAAITREGISVGEDVSGLSYAVPKHWLAPAGKPARYFIDVSKVTDSTIKSCPYTENHTLILKQHIDQVVITDLETNTEIARQSFTGKYTKDNLRCPQTRFFNEPVIEQVVTYPDSEGFTKWLAKVMAPYGFVP